MHHLFSRTADESVCDQNMMRKIHSQEPSLPSSTNAPTKLYSKFFIQCLRSRDICRLLCLCEWIELGGTKCILNDDRSCTRIDWEAQNVYLLLNKTLKRLVSYKSIAFTWGSPLFSSSHWRLVKTWWLATWNVPHLNLLMSMPIVWLTYELWSPLPLFSGYHIWVQCIMVSTF